MSARMEFGNGIAKSDVFVITSTEKHHDSSKPVLYAINIQKRELIKIPI
jgi:hypothetical protein